jgi:hypothetical protein
MSETSVYSHLQKVLVRFPKRLLICQANTLIEANLFILRTCLALLKYRIAQVVSKEIKSDRISETYINTVKNNDQHKALHFFIDE